MAAFLATQYLRPIHLSATSGTAAEVTGSMALITVTLIAAALAAVVRAARVLTALMAEFLQVVAAITSILFAIVVSAIALGILLAHH